MKWITVLLSLFTLLAPLLSAQNSDKCSLSKGRNYGAQITYNISDNVVYEGPNKHTALYTLQNNKVYKGKNISESNVQYVIKDKYVYEIYQGKEKILFNIKDGEIYNMNSTSRLEILYTIKDGKIYKGRSTSTLDIVMTFCDTCHNKELIALLTYITFA